jgi:proton-coupled amino acid transporter
MSLPQIIYPNKTRRESIAKLTRSPLSSSPLLANSPSSRIHSVANSYNGAFLKSGNLEEALDIQSSNELEIPEEEFHERGSADFSIGMDDPRNIELLSKHLPTNTLRSEGGDITRELFKISQDPRESPRRSRSWSSDRERRGSTASSLNVPGGFRRDFVLSKHDSIRTKTPNFVTRNFVEFLSMYGHFAGEDLEDDDDIFCHYKSVTPDQIKYLDEQVPLLPSNPSLINRNGTATDSKAYFLLLKAFVGTGVLFLPRAFSNGGLVFSIVVLLLFGFLSYWCYLILIYSKVATKVSSFGELGLRLYGNWLQRLILSSIIISQIGFVAAYIVFTSENLRAFVSNVTQYEIEDLNIMWFTLFQVIILLPLSLLRDLTKLSLLSVIANLFIFLGLATIIYFILQEWLYTNHGVLGEGIEFFFNKSDFSLFIGVSIFAFEGIGLIIPIQETMIYPNHFPKVLFQVIATISIIFICMGTVGYLAFGKDVKTVIILNLPQDSPMIIMTQLLYSIAILLSTPLQLFPAIKLLENKIFPKKTGKGSLTVKWSKNIFRFAFVVFVAVVAYFGGQNLDKFISFVGCFACVPMVYMYPPILHLKSCCNLHSGLSEKEARKRYWLGILDYVLVVIGGVAMVYTTYCVLVV